MHVTSRWEAEKKSESNGWIFFAFIKKLKHFISTMLAAWGNACHTHIMLAVEKKSQSNGWNFSAFIKNLKPFVIPMHVTWGT